MSNRVKAIIGALATIAVWATAFPFSKIALQHVDSLTLSVARVVGGGYVNAYHWCGERITNSYELA